MNPPTIRMRLVCALTLAGRVHPAGAIVVIGIDVARHLRHHHRAVPANPADLSRLLDAPRTLPR